MLYFPSKFLRRSRDKVPHRFWSYLPEVEKWAESGIIQMFKLPTYEWLRDKVNKLGNPDLVLPPKESSVNIIVEDKVPTKMDSHNKFHKNNYCIDIETEPITDSPLKALMFKSIQLDNQFITVTKKNLPELKE